MNLPGKRKAIALLAALALSLAVGTPAYGRASWEPVKTEPRELKSVAKDTEVEIKTANGMIIVKTERPVNVKVFTILGQLVSNETVGPGIVRLNINAHGVYIIKIGDLTCKVAL